MALALAVLPLQAVSASEDSVPCHSTALPHHVQGDTDAGMVMDMEHDDIQVVCADCSGASHCSACITGLVSAFVTELSITPELTAMAMKTGDVRNISSSLYRPPRV